MDSSVLGNKVKLFVGNLPFATDEEELRTRFELCGRVRKAKIVRHETDGQSRGFGFVEMQTPAEAQVALEKMNKAEFGSRLIDVSIARERSNEV